jgi:hypothetical protein
MNLSGVVFGAQFRCLFTVKNFLHRLTFKILFRTKDY